MINEKKIKWIVSSLMIVSLLFYHFTNLVAPKDNDIFDVYKLAQFTTMILFMLIAYSEKVVKIAFGEGYIAGIYDGYSTYYIDERKEKNVSTEDKEIKRQIHFKIKQSFFGTTIFGKSFDDDNNEIVSTWNGNLFKAEENMFYFALELTTSVGEFGILKLSFDKENIHGFYYSGEPNSKYAYKVVAKKQAI